jgi:hypothetical protein
LGGFPDSLTDEPGGLAAGIRTFQDRGVRVRFIELTLNFSTLPYYACADFVFIAAIFIVGASIDKNEQQACFFYF